MKKGVLLVNLGTPNALSKSAIHAYLTEFLLDKNVVDLPRFLWKPLLTHVILPKRIPKLIEHYRAIWHASNQSPLLFYCRSLVDQLNQQTTISKPTFALAMTYDAPSIQSALRHLLHEKQCDQVLILPLYPQYSSTTTLPIIEQAQQFIKAHKIDKHRLRWILDYYDRSAYIDALINSIQAHFTQHELPDCLLLSYHGIPARYVKKRRDPYVAQCEATTQRLQNRLKVIYPDLKVDMSFQSRFGKGKWIEPNTSDVLLEFAKQQQSVSVICPGFAVDCLETLHEIALENRDLYQQHHGKAFSYIPALNDSKWQVELILNLLAT